MVHDTGQWPLIDEYGMNINPSSYTEVAITEVRISEFLRFRYQTGGVI